MQNYNMNHEFRKYKFLHIPYTKIMFPFINLFLSFQEKRFKVPTGIKKTVFKIPGFKSQLIKLSVFEPEETTEALPCLLYLHGGGFSMKASKHHYHFACAYAKKTPCKVVFVDYHLSPKNPYPAALTDCENALHWVYEKAYELGIRPDKIAVGGDSAGGALAAALTHMSRDKGYPKICFQMLLYPVTDMRQQTESIGKFKDTPLWNSVLNQKMWDYYLSAGFDKSKLSYISPAQADNFLMLPCAYLEVAEFDCLKDEGIYYAKMLEKNGVFVMLHQTKGTIHGYDIEIHSETVEESLNLRIEALQDAFYHNL